MFYQNSRRIYQPAQTSDFLRRRKRYRRNFIWWRQRTGLIIRGAARRFWKTHAGCKKQFTHLSSNPRQLHALDYEIGFGDLEVKATRGGRSKAGRNAILTRKPAEHLNSKLTIQIGSSRKHSRRARHLATCDLIRQRSAAIPKLGRAVLDWKWRCRRREPSWYSLSSGLAYWMSADRRTSERICRLIRVFWWEISRAAELIRMYEKASSKNISGAAFITSSARSNSPSSLLTNLQRVCKGLRATRPLRHSIISPGARHNRRKFRLKRSRPQNSSSIYFSFVFSAVSDYPFKSSKLF